MMKQSIKIFYLCIIIFFTYCRVNAQKTKADSSLNFLELQPLNNQIRVRFELKSGATCNVINLERLNNNKFEVVSTIDGICGSPDFSIEYIVFDSLPDISKTIYYRLQLGNLGYTSVDSIKITLFENKKKLEIAPNQLLNEIKVTFNEPSSIPYQLTIYGINSTQHLSFNEVQQPEIVLKNIRLSSGIYYLQIIDKKREQRIGQLFYY